MARYYVNGNNSTSGSGVGSWANAKKTLGEVLALTLYEEDEIWIAKGVYKPDTITSNYHVQNGVKIYGSFLGYETSVDDRPTIATTPSLMDLDLGATAHTKFDGLFDNEYMLNLFYADGTLIPACINNIVFDGIEVTNCRNPFGFFGTENKNAIVFRNILSKHNVGDCELQSVDMYLINWLLKDPALNHGYADWGLDISLGIAYLEDIVFDGNFSAQSPPLCMDGPGHITGKNITMRNVKVGGGAGIISTVAQNKSYITLTDVLIENVDISEAGAAVFWAMDGYMEINRATVKNLIVGQESYLATVVNDGTQSNNINSNFINFNNCDFTNLNLQSKNAFSITDGKVSMNDCYHDNSAIFNATSVTHKSKIKKINGIDASLITGIK